MTLPLTTTTVTVASMAEPEPYEGETPSARLSGVPAHIGPASAFAQHAGGGAENHDAALFIDVAVSRGERVTDDTTGIVWRADRSNRRTGLGLDHYVVGLHRESGQVPT